MGDPLPSELQFGANRVEVYGYVECFWLGLCFWIHHSILLDFFSVLLHSYDYVNYILCQTMKKTGHNELFSFFLLLNNFSAPMPMILLSGVLINIMLIFDDD